MRGARASLTKTGPQSFTRCVGDLAQYSIWGKCPGQAPSTRPPVRRAGRPTPDECHVITLRQYSERGIVLVRNQIADSFTEIVQKTDAGLAAIPNSAGEHGR